jgi:hypothetical protein
MGRVMFRSETVVVAMVRFERIFVTDISLLPHVRNYVIAVFICPSL